MGEINWRDNWDSALEEAKKENRRVLLELYMDGCPHCMKLHSETHVDPGVVQEVNSTTLIFGADGKELQRFPGYYPAADYLKQLEKTI